LIKSFNKFLKNYNSGYFNFNKRSYDRNNNDIKGGAVSKLLACGFLGQPIWTPRRYDALAYEGYQKNVIAYRCVNLIARSIASVPWLLYERRHLGGGVDNVGLVDEHEIDHHPLLSLLNAPCDGLAGAAFMETVVSHLLLSGNAYIEMVQREGDFLDGDLGEDDVKNPAFGLYPLRPDRVKIIPGEDGSPLAFEYSVGAYKRQIPAKRVYGGKVVPSVLHLRLFNPLNDWYGMSPLEAASAAIDQHNAVAGHNLALMQNGGRPSGAFVIKPGPHGQTLSEEQRQSLRSDLRAAYEGARNAGRIIMLEGDFEWREMGLSPKDLDFIEGKNLSAREISQAFGVPPMLAGVPGDATFANYKEARFHLWEDTILPLLDLLVAEFNGWLVPVFGDILEDELGDRLEGGLSGGLRLGYDADSIPALAPRREAAWAKIANANFLTINEKRQAVGYGPLPGGDVL